jgi:putative copper export protein
MLSFNVDVLRLTLHLLGVSVWVGGQLVLAGVVPGLRELNADAPRFVARKFNRVAWVAFCVTVITGVWNLLAIDIGDTSSAYQVTLAVKLALVAVSGLAAEAHSLASSKLVLALGGALGLLAGLGALVVGVLLRAGT